MSAANAVYGEIEIGLHRTQLEGFEVQLRVADPGTEGEIAPVRGATAIAIDKLVQVEHDPKRYGEVLTEQLFHDAAVRQFYDTNKATLDRSGLMIRMRVLIGTSAPELHAVRWELLCDPSTQVPLATSQRVLVSRFMVSRDWRVIRLRPKAELKALIAVSSPSDIEEFGMAVVDKAGEVARASEALGNISKEVLGVEQPLTLDRLVAGINKGVDIVYLVCHGALPKGGEPRLFLQNEDGMMSRALAGDLAREIAGMQNPPRLMVLASCEGAGTEDAASSADLTAQAALAPRLADAGVPAIIAMQGQIDMETVKAAMPVFFTELLKDGQIDRAMAAARNASKRFTDSWMPALFLRLKNGRIWYEPGFGGQGAAEFEKWAGICSRVRNGQFIPILGPELGEDLFGGTREMSSRLAEKHGFPLAEHDRADLAKVTQYLATHHDRIFAQDEVQNQFLRQVAERVGTGGAAKSLPELLDLGLARCKQDPDHPYNVLAKLPATIYVNASQEPMLARALKASGRSPEVVSGAWRPGGKEVPRAPQPKVETPTPETPWVYHVFGIFGKRDSMVLTEDDFLDYLIATSTLNLMPTRVRGALPQNSLLFLGFRLDDWRFRVFFRMLMTIEGLQTANSYRHVGVQVNPEEHSLADVQRARRYLESYFGGVPPISIFWGTATDFLRELQKKLAETQVEETQAVLVPAAEEEWV